MISLARSLTLALLVGGMTTDRLTIRFIGGPMVLQGRTIRVICHVPLDERNRWLTVGVENYLGSGQGLEGENAAITFEVPFDHMPCEATAVYCAVDRNDGTHDRVAQKIHMVNCGED